MWKALVIWNPPSGHIEKRAPKPYCVTGGVIYAGNIKISHTLALLPRSAVKADKEVEYGSRFMTWTKA